MAKSKNEELVGDYKYLSDIEIEKIKLFINDHVMREAVRKCLFAGVYSNGVIRPDRVYEARRNWALSIVDVTQQKQQSDEQIGQELRANVWATNMVEGAFQRMEQDYNKIVTVPEKKKNPAI